MVGETENAADLAMAFDERAAILEHDAGFSRAGAERRARSSTDGAAERLAPPVTIAAPGAAPALVSGPGVRIVTPAVEVSAAEYDRHLDALIAAAGEGSPEASRLAYAKRKGWVVPRGEGRIFTRGR